MSLSSAFKRETLIRLAALEQGDFDTFASAITLGYKPKTFFDAVQAFKDGRDPELPNASGQPKPITVNAWSFVNDKNQYHGVYGLSSAEAAELKDLLMGNRDEAVRQIDAVVSAHMRRKGSNKAVAVSLAGMPGDTSGPGAGSSQPVASELKQEIASNGSRYGRYKFDAVGTPYEGPHAFSVKLGKGFSAFFNNKRGAIDVARVCRVRGRFFPLVAGYVGFLPPGERTHIFGDSIPGKADWDCTLGPDDDLPADPVSKAGTVVK